jgi:hypothetical protein
MLVFVRAGREFLGMRCENRDTKFATWLGQQWLLALLNGHNLGQTFLSQE